MKALKYLVILPILFLAGCAQLDYGFAVMSDQMCTIHGQNARLVFRNTQDFNFREADKAVCARCPGEEALQCTGDPKALPANP